MVDSPRPVSDEECPLLSQAVVDAAYGRYARSNGDEPTDDVEPTAAQLAALSYVVDKKDEVP